MSSQPAPTTREPESPCRCHSSWAYIAPWHNGHCCFVPASQTCHAAEVAEWERQRDLRRPAPKSEAVQS